MSSTVTIVREVMLNMYIYVGMIEVTLGTIGNILTMIIFTQNPLRSTRSAPFLIFLSLLNLIYLDLNVFPNIIVNYWGQSDSSFGSDVICILRTWFLWTCITISTLLFSWLVFDR